MNAIALIEKYYPPGSLAHQALLRHSVRVTRRAVAIAERLSRSSAVDVPFVEEAALLHDIGMIHTDAPEIGCFGTLPYLAHSYKGRELLEAEGLPCHALVCDRHVGIGLSAAEIVAQGLPLPHRDMLPLTVEEQIITYADLFFSKSPDENDRPRSPEQVRRKLAGYGEEKVAVFDTWQARFEPCP
jgi:uncharacterized protein